MHKKAVTRPTSNQHNRNLGHNPETPKARSVTCVYVRRHQGSRAIACILSSVTAIELRVDGMAVPQDIEWRWHVRGSHEAHDGIKDLQKVESEWNRIVVESQSQKDQLRESNDLAHLREATKILLS